MQSTPLSKDQKQRAKELIRSRATDMTCPTCGDVQWGLQERLHVMPAMDPNGSVDPSMGFPAVILTCKACYHVRVYNAIQMGLVDQG